MIMCHVSTFIVLQESAYLHKHAWENVSEETWKINNFGSKLEMWPQFCKSFTKPYFFLLS